jgi:tripartite-type tricarboxylate transporter receptor subunit TctC
MAAGTLRLIGLSAALMLAAASAQAQGTTGDFYKDKQIRLILGTDSGGGYDAYARVLARFMGKHIPGNPSFVVQNMTGAAGIVAANYLYNVAPKDGTVILTFPNNVPFVQILGQPGPMFEAVKFGWIGSLTSEVTVCVAWHTAKAKTLAEAKEHEVLVGGSGPNNTETTPAVLNAALGTKFKIITGYSSSTTVALAVERGEVEAICTAYSTLANRNASWFSEKKVNILVQAALRRHPALPDVPLALDLAATPEDRALLELNDARVEVARPFVAPPGLPPERLQSLRTAFEAMIADSEFKAEMAKQKLELNPLTGPQAEALLIKVSKTPRSVIDRLNEALAPKTDKAKEK